MAIATILVACVLATTISRQTNSRLEETTFMMSQNKDRFKVEFYWPSPSRTTGSMRYLERDDALAFAKALKDAGWSVSVIENAEQPVDIEL